MEDENLNEEKLLANPETPEMLASGETHPYLSGKEFISKTSVEELKNVFGITDRELPNPKTLAETKLAVPANPKEQPEKFSFLPKLIKKTPPPEQAVPNTVKPEENSGTAKKISRLATALLLIIILIIIGLYIWGGILKGSFANPIGNISIG
jgi:hypothetical protein